TVQLKQAQGRLAALQKAAPSPSSADPGADTGPQVPELTGTIAELESELRRVQTAAPPEPPATGDVMAVRDAAAPADCAVCIRGDIDNRGEPVPRGVLSVLLPPGQAPAIAGPGSGRLELARWLASERNPLTARVLVNRVWYHLFGTGLVRSVDNF